MGHSACQTGSEGAIALYAQEEAVTDTSLLESDELSSKNFELYKVTNRESCGVRGCDFGLYVLKNGCLFSAFAAYGAKIRGSSSWKKISVTEKALPVDGPSLKKVYQYDENTFTYVLKK